MGSSFSTPTCQMKPLSVTHRVKIVALSLTDVFCPRESIQFGTFAVGEYQWAIVYYPHGINIYTDISFFLELLSEAKDVWVNLRFSLVDKNGRASPHKAQSNLFIFRKKGEKNGFGNFVTRNYLVSSGLLKDGSFTVECSLQIIRPSIEEGKENSSISVPPSNLHQHLHHLLQSGEGADVSFKVRGENFPVHRSILAARSSVFRAELLGSMRESNAKCIEISDMEPQVFKTLLQFIYTDMLHPSDGHTDEGVDEDIMAQHLIVAADRYDLGRLRLICEDELAKKIDSHNVVTTLALAARHNCQQLKEICLGYISSSEVVHSIIETEEFEHLIMSCPSIYKELLRKLLLLRRS